VASSADHFREAKRLREEADRWLDADAGWKASLSSDDRIARRNSDLLAAQVEATLALADAMRGDAPPARAGTSRYGAEFDRLVSSWQVLEDEHDQIHPDRDQCGGVGGCPMMFAAVGLETRMIDQLTEWRWSVAVREGRAACSCDHHGDHAGCDHSCECAS